MQSSITWKTRITIKETKILAQRTPGLNRKANSIGNCKELRTHILKVKAVFRRKLIA